MHTLDNVHTRAYTGRTIKGQPKHVYTSSQKKSSTKYAITRSFQGICKQVPRMTQVPKYKKLSEEYERFLLWKEPLQNYYIRKGDHEAMLSLQSSADVHAMLPAVTTVQIYEKKKKEEIERRLTIWLQPSQTSLFKIQTSLSYNLCTGTHPIGKIYGKVQLKNTVILC